MSAKVCCAKSWVNKLSKMVLKSSQDSLVDVRFNLGLNVALKIVIICLRIFSLICALHGVFNLINKLKNILNVS